jgi:hypothetical protein
VLKIRQLRRHSLEGGADEHRKASGWKSNRVNWCMKDRVLSGDVMKWE